MFIDVDAISPGSDFADAIDRAVRQCDAVVAVIGRRWLDAALSDGRRRLDQPNDFVRLELESALGNGVPVIPTAVQGAAFPDARSLPSTLEPLARRQGIELRDTAWRDDVQRLIRRLEPQRRRPGRRLLLLAGVAAAIAAIGATTLALTLSGGSSPPGDRADPQLVAAVPAATRPSCHAISFGEQSANASIECTGVRLDAIYNRFANTGVMTDWYEQKREATGIAASTGTCSATSFRGEAAYADGRHLCYVQGGQPQLVWTDPQAKIGATANIYQGTGTVAASSLLRQWNCCLKPPH